MRERTLLNFMSALDRIKQHLQTFPELSEKLAVVDFDEMMEHINDKAKKEAVGGVACIEDNDVFGWAVEFVTNYDPNAPKKPKKVETPKKVEAKKEEVKKEEPASKEMHKEDGTKADQINIFGRFE